MIVFAKLMTAVLLQILASTLLYVLDKKTSFGGINYWAKQVIIGVIFGLLAIFATEFSTTAYGASINVRDAAPLTAGLIFGGPAGIIAGVIGGVERWIAVAWGVGSYTRVACSVTCVLAGIVAALLRRFMFEGKLPSSMYGLAIGAIMEIWHMLMVFFTNIGDAKHAFQVVQNCVFLMASLNGVSVMLSIMIISIISRGRITTDRHGLKNISQTFQRALLICTVIAFLATSGFTWALQTRMSDTDTTDLMKLNISDVNSEVMDASDKNLLSVTRSVASQLRAASVDDQTYLAQLAQQHNVAEIDIINENGVITSSTNSDFVGYNMANGKQSAEFLCLLNGQSEYVQSYQPMSYNTSVYRKYAGVTLGRGFIQVGYDAGNFQQDIKTEIQDITRNRHVGSDGYLIVADASGNIVSAPSASAGVKDLASAGISIDTSSPQESEKFVATVYGTDSYCMYSVTEGYYIVAVIPQTTVRFSRDLPIYITAFMEVVVFTVLFVLIYFLIRKLIVDNIRKVNASLAEITGGNLNVTVEVRSNEEFASLSDDINSTVLTLKQYIAEAAARIDKELEFAKNIQYSALPSVFPPFPKRNEFAIFAQMNTAKEVGGDFYDFYFVRENLFVFLIADVSGKGIPAALFMMRAKTLLKSLVETKGRAEVVFGMANDNLCEENDAGMFLTAWMGILDTNTGLVTFANAGHDPALVRHADGGFEYLRTPAGFILAGMEGMKYKKNELQLQPGDKVFLYTDGVTEATRADKELFGMNRLLESINRHAGEDPETICRLVKADVDEFVGDVPQFDDITMVCLEYNGLQGAEPRFSDGGGPNFE